MRRALVSLVVLAVVLSGLPATVAGAHGSSGVDCEFPITVQDGTGTDVTVEEEPTRVVVLGPSGAQTMWAIGAAETVVGMPVNRYTSYLNGSADRANVVGSRGKPVAEKVVAQEPDLVIASGINSKESVRALRDLETAEFPVVRMPAESSLADVYVKIETVGRLVGAFDAAARTAAEMNGTVTAIRGAVADRDRPTVYFAMGGGWTAGPDTYIGAMLAAAGGSNLARAANISAYGQISQEVIAAEDPDWIVLGENTPMPANPAVNGSTAVESDQVLRVNDDFLSQPGPRNVVPLQRMAAAFHPDAGVDAAVDAATPGPVTKCKSDLVTATSTATATQTATESTPPATTTTAPNTTTSGGAGPGFAVPVAVGALVGLALVLTRHRV
jgi:iron complex transport system substrate-binding protein